MNPGLVALLSLLTFMLFGCATPESPDGSIQKYDVVHVAQVVGDSYFLIDPDAYERFRETTFRYDQRFRRPDLPGPTSVECSTVDNIGVVYMLVVQARPAWRKIKVKYRWRHDAVHLRDSDLDTFTNVIVFPNFTEIFTHERLFLTDEHRKDGVFTLTASIDGSPVLQSSFELVGCPDVGPGRRSPG